MDIQAIKAEVRLIALEYLVANLFAVALVSQPDRLKSFEDTIRGRFANQTIPGIDPAMSDMMAAELEDAVERLVEMIKGIAQSAPNGPPANDK